MSSVPQAVNISGASFQPLQIDSDAVLLRRYRIQGDRKAFEELFRKYQGPIYGLIVRLIGNEDAYDLTQDVFVRSLRSMHTFRGDCSFRTWLYTIARHLCYNHMRDEKRRHAIEEILGEHDENSDKNQERELPDPHMDVAKIAETNELQKIVQKILCTMSIEQRLLITLRDFEGLSYEEIAEISELSLVNVKSKLHRARCAFKTKFEPYWRTLNSEEAEHNDSNGAFRVKPEDKAMRSKGGE